MVSAFSLRYIVLATPGNCSYYVCDDGIGSTQVASNHAGGLQRAERSKFLWQVPVHILTGNLPQIPHMA